MVTQHLHRLPGWDKVQWVYTKSLSTWETITLTDMPQEERNEITYIATKHEV